MGVVFENSSTRSLTSSHECSFFVSRNTKAIWIFKESSLTCHQRYRTIWHCCSYEPLLPPWEKSVVRIEGRSEGVICEDAWETPLLCVTYEIFGAPGGQQTKQLAARMPWSETGEKHIPIAPYSAALDFLHKFIQKKMLNRCVKLQAKRSGPVRGQMS